jgi:hypothetical protein
VTCKESVRKLRRCGDDREDFTKEDGAFWPIQLYQGGELYGFCPAKATWDMEIVSVFKLLILSAETGNIVLVQGAIEDQPAWWLDQVSWFVPKYKQIQFISRVKMIIGDGKVTTGKIQTPQSKR